MKLILPLLWSSLVLGGPIVQPEKRQLKEILNSTGLTKVIEDMGLTEAINGLGLNTILSVLERVMPLEIPKVNSLAPKIRTTTKRSRVMWGPYDFQPTSNVCPFMTRGLSRCSNSRKGDKVRIFYASSHDDWPTDGSQRGHGIQEFGWNL